jgi:hypothetical protein
MIAALGERPHPYRDLLVAARSLAGPVGLPAAAGTAEVPA